MLALLMLAGGCHSPLPARSTAPDTSRDPDPFVPAPELEAQARDETIGLYTARYLGMGNGVVRRFVEAVARANGPAIQEQFAERVGIFDQSRPPALPRVQLAALIFSGPARPQFAAFGAEHFVQLDELTVQTVSESSTNVPAGYRGDDLVVRVPLTGPGNELFQRVRQFWRERMTLVIRQTDDGPRIVAL